ncbi:MAG: TfoX/Sxy family DNA transformation protein [Flavobacteriaceae bacterium]|nr:TfoX/Sxy family DNA transformation protein [Flavobacteriaceae bacterium]
MSELTTLKNIGKASALLLQRIDIHTIEQLRSTDLEEIFECLVQIGVKPNRNFFYAIEAALVNKNILQITPNQKQKIEALFTSSDF